MILQVVYGDAVLEAGDCSRIEEKEEAIEDGILVDMIPWHVTGEGWMAIWPVTVLVLVPNH